jgi:hypothetical protein
MKRDLVINIVLIVVGVVLAFLLFAAGVRWKSKTSTGRPSASIAGPAGQMERDHLRSKMPADVMWVFSAAERC